MFGWCGKIARIDLSGKRVEKIDLDPEICSRFTGGRGMAGHYLKDRITLDWHDPGMPLLLFTGPLTGTASPTSGRMTVMSRSPLTGTVGDSSVGGALGTHLKKAGLDGLIITGRHKTLCGIEITDNSISIVSCPQLAGQTVSTVLSRLKPRGAAAVIGPAAENGVLFAGLIVDGEYAAGRGGIGCCFAAKNLKYITVNGSGRVPVADQEALKKAREDIFRLVSASPALSGPFGLSRFGTPALYDLTDARHMMPTQNFTKTRFDAASAANAHALHRHCHPENTGCSGCHIRCKKKTRHDGHHLPEFETLSHFTALISNDDLETVLAANRVCNDLGMDTISAASVLACHFEICGIKPSSELVISLLTDIAAQRGTGIDPGKGAARYAEIMGKPEAAMAVKHLELPAYDPRGAYGMALAYAVATRGGDHLRAYPILHEILRKPVPTDRFSFAGKARIIRMQEDVNAMADSLTACKFTFFAASLEEYARVYTAVTGIAASGQDLSDIGERICYHERIMNAACGFDATSDDLPGRFFEAPGENGGPPPIDRKAFLSARAAYYRVRGLDEKGRPTPEKTAELGLSR